MRPQPQTITLGDQEFLVRPLTLHQVREIEPLLMDGPGGVSGSMAVVEIALRREHPERAANLGDIEATALEIAVAMSQVLRLGGFIESEAPGEKAAAEI